MKVRRQFDVNRLAKINAKLMLKFVSSTSAIYDISAQQNQRRSKSAEIRIGAEKK